MINQAGFERRQFLKTGGALVVGFTLAPPTFAQNPGQVTGGPNGAAQPSADQLDTWIAIHGDNTATVFIGHCELGQGVTTTLLQIAAEELDLDMSQVKSIGLRNGEDAEPGPDHGERGYRTRRRPDSSRRGGSASCAPRSRRRAPGRSRRIA